MLKKLSVSLVVILVVSVLLSGTAFAQEPTGDFETVRARIAAWLESGPTPAVSVDSVFENMNDGDPSNDPYILSVRAPEDYAKGHVPGAANIPWRSVAKSENLATLPMDQKILDYCYTGHTGQVAMTALNLMGYQADNMKWGIMAWTKDDEVLGLERFDPAAVPDYRVETEPNEAMETYAFPELDVEGTAPEEVIQAAVDSYLSSGKAPTISADAVFENLNDGDPSNDPVILSVRAPEDYAKGHIPGAINIPWTQLGNPENLAKLPPDKPIVAYCYTGHTGQIATTLLSVLGYDVTNLKFGMMSWSKDPEVVATTIFDPATQADYRLETGEMMAEEEAMAEEETMAEEEGMMEEEAMEEMTAAEEMAELFGQLDPAMQEAVLSLLRAISQMAPAPAQ